MGVLVSCPTRAGIVAMLAVVGLAAGPISAQDRETPSEELRRLYEADQADRHFTSPPTPDEWAEISGRDHQRRDRVIEMLRADLMSTADDYYHGAMVLQHGEGTEDILLAHILATAAGFKGREDAQWLSAAALDRYLHRMDQPQRLGTQYVKVDPEKPFELDPSFPWTQGKYESWLPDSLRAVFGVPPLADQQARVEQMNGGSSP